jgi:5-methylcytosine-specific restriction endonuclease McrA
VNHTLGVRREHGCSVKRCPHPHEALGLCKRHYWHWKRTRYPIQLTLPFQLCVYAMVCSACGASWSYQRWTPLGHLPQRCPTCHAAHVAAAGRAANLTEEARERRRLARRKWRLANPALMAAARHAWEASNPETRRGYRRERKRRFPEVNRSYVRARKARKQRLTVAAFTPAQLLQRLAYYGGRCWMCGATADCIDHVKPLSRGGAHMLCNLRPACTPCNTRKGANWPWPVIRLP